MLPNSIVLLVCYSTFVYFPLEEKDNCLLTTPPNPPLWKLSRYNIQCKCQLVNFFNDFHWLSSIDCKSTLNSRDKILNKSLNQSQLIFFIMEKPVRFGSLIDQFFNEFWKYFLNHGDLRLKFYSQNEDSIKCIYMYYISGTVVHLCVL